MVSGPAGVGTTDVVEEPLRAYGSKISRESAAAPEGDERVWWIEDAQRMPAVGAVPLPEEAAARTIVVSGRRPLGPGLAGLVRAALRADSGAR